MAKKRAEKFIGFAVNGNEEVGENTVKGKKERLDWRPLS